MSVSASRQRTIDIALILVACAGLAWCAWSYATRGFVFVVFDTARDGGRSLDAVRELLAPAGVWAPLVYVAAVIVEVLVAPLPGTLLYAPGGALFGGWFGGTLSLAGNVIGASIAAWLAARFRHRLPGLTNQPGLEKIMSRIRARGLFVVALLRVNPFTSSDLVSYAAGLVGIPVWRVAVGTLVGMAPLCYAQAHASAWLFDVLPGAGVVLVVSGVAYLALVVWILGRGRAT